jgi:hypothetical protein
MVAYCARRSSSGTFICAPAYYENKKGPPAEADGPFQALHLGAQLPLRPHQGKALMLTHRLVSSRGQGPPPGKCRTYTDAANAQRS